MIDYINIHGLINPTKADVVSENAPLTTLQYHLLSGDGKFLDRNLDYLNKMKVDGHDGLYNQLPERHGNKDDYTSPDQLIAFVGTLYLKKQIGRIVEIREHLKKNAFTYDNVSPNSINFRRLMQPSAILFTAVSSGYWAYRPALAATMLYSCATSEGKTSGKMKAWTIGKSIDMDWTLDLCETILNGFDSWDDVIKTFYSEESHPIRKIIDNELKYEAGDIDGK